MGATNGINVDTQTLVETAGKMRQINNSLFEKLGAINQCMNALEGSFQSESGDEIRRAMNALKPQFAKYKEIVEQYAVFLVKTAESYESTTGAQKQRAAAIGSAFHQR